MEPSKASYRARKKGAQLREDVLDMTHQALELGKEVTEFVPLPGLGLAIDLLIKLVEKAQVSSRCTCVRAWTILTIPKNVGSNQDNLENLCQSVRCLNDAICAVARPIDSKVKEFPIGKDRDKIHRRLRIEASDLTTRISSLTK